MESVASHLPLPVMLSKSRLSNISTPPSRTSRWQTLSPYLLSGSYIASPHDEEAPVPSSEAPFHSGTAEEALVFPSTWHRVVWLKTMDNKVFRVLANVVKNSYLIADVTGGHMCIGGSSMPMAIPLYTIDSRILTILLEFLNGLNAIHRLESAKNSVTRSLGRIQSRKDRWAPYPQSFGSRARPATRASTRLISKASKRFLPVKDQHQEMKESEATKNEAIEQWRRHLGTFDLDTLFRILAAADFLDIESLVFECNQVDDTKLRNPSGIVSASPFSFQDPRGRSCSHRLACSHSVESHRYVCILV